MSLHITPDTKVGALLEAYPACEKVLIAMAPEFAKLRNPVLRRTVAKIATLEQAAKIGGVSLRTMIRELRIAAGQESGNEELLEERSAGPDETWAANAPVVEELDADAILDRGEHPLGKIRQAMTNLEPGQALLLRSTFRPEPLIETMRKAGAAVHSEKKGSTYSTYFVKRGDEAGPSPRSPR